MFLALLRFNALKLINWKFEIFRSISENQVSKLAGGKYFKTSMLPGIQPRQVQLIWGPTYFTWILFTWIRVTKTELFQCFIFNFGSVQCNTCSNVQVAESVYNAESLGISHAKSYPTLDTRNVKKFSESCQDGGRKEEGKKESSDAEITIKLLVKENSRELTSEQLHLKKSHITDLKQVTNCYSQRWVTM